MKQKELYIYLNEMHPDVIISAGRRLPAKDLKSAFGAGIHHTLLRLRVHTKPDAHSSVHRFLLPER